MYFYHLYLFSCKVRLRPGATDIYIKAWVVDNWCLDTIYLLY
jgi:hypothetical protein